MSRHVGQVTPVQALAGAAAIAVVVAAVVVLCYLLLLPFQTVPELDAPAQEAALAPGAVVCPAPGELPEGPDALTVASAQLIDCPDVYDGRRLAYQGEVVGAVLQRGERAWVQLNDDPYGLALGPLPAHRTTVGGNSGLAVSVPIEVARSIEHVGDHDQRGDVLSVVGTFRRADPADGGGPTIQADAARVAVEGARISHPLSTRRAATAGLFAAVTAFVGFRTWVARRRA